MDAARQTEAPSDDEPDYQTHYSSLSATRGSASTLRDDIEEELEWPIDWERSSIGDWAEYMERTERAKMAMLNGNRVKVVEEEAAEVDISSFPGAAATLEDAPSLLVAELGALANWEATVTLRTQRGWAADLKKECEQARKKEERKEKREDVSGGQEGGKQSGAGRAYRSATKFKPKGVKVVPVDTQLPDKYRTSMIFPPLSRDPTPRHSLRIHLISFPEDGLRQRGWRNSTSDRLDGSARRSESSFARTTAEGEGVSVRRVGDRAKRRRSTDQQPSSRRSTTSPGSKIPSQFPPPSERRSSPCSGNKSLRGSSSRAKHRTPRSGSPCKSHRGTLGLFSTRRSSTR